MNGSLSAGSLSAGSPSGGEGREPARRRRAPRAPFPVLAPLLLLLALLSACSMKEKENRLTLNALDASFAPSSEGARWALAPVALPAGLVALAVDAVVVHPATVVDDAWGDTVEWLWTPKPDESRFRRAVLLPLSALATPLVWVGDWLGRSVFAIEPREEPS